MEPARSFIFSDSLLSLSSHPLFSVFVASTILAVLYVPAALLPLLLSPVSVSAIILLFSLLLRLAPPPPDIVDDLTVTLSEEPNTEINVQSQEIDRKLQKEILCDDSYADRHRWSGPLEVIYEEYEGEEQSVGNSPEYSRWSQDYTIGGGGGRGVALGSLAFAYSDSDTESSGSSGSPTAADGWGSQEKISFRWPEDLEVSEGDDDEDQLIEIELEEDNLIEIDIFGGR